MNSYKTLVENRISSLREVAKFHGFRVIRPVVDYNLKGVVAGTMSNDGTMQLNQGLMSRNLEDFIITTVGHEFAHHICFQMWPNLVTAHGPEWKAVMVKLGLKPDRCHNYDTSEVKLRELKKFQYVCLKCEEKVVFTSIRHNKVTMKGINYTHNSCGGSFEFVKALGQVSYKAAQAAK